jgi:phage-related holin
MLEMNSVSASIERAITNISIGWPVKVGVSAGLLLCQKHLAIFALFMLLVIIDLGTKWIALAYSNIVKNGIQKPSVMTCIYGIPAAHRTGVISSAAMKNQFVGKIVVYMILTLSGCAIDGMMSGLSHNTNFASLVIGYLAATELLSIVENLDDAGVSAMHDLASMIKRRTNR